MQIIEYNYQKKKNTLVIKTVLQTLIYTEIRIMHYKNSI